MLKITFVGHESGDSFDLYEITSIIVYDNGDIIKEYPVRNQEELLSWKNKVNGWYVHELASNFVTFVKEPKDADMFLVSVCLDCGNKKWQYFRECSSCGSRREPLFVGV